MNEQKYPSQLAERFQIRMPDGLREQIRRHAEANKRSMNAEIISLLEMALWEADYDRVTSGLEPFGAISQEDRDRLALHEEDRQRRAAQRTKALSEHGVDGVLADIVTRLDSIEKKLDEK